MAAEYSAAGQGAAQVTLLRCKAAHLMNDDALAAEQFERWQQEQGGDSDDCAACLTDFKVTHHLNAGELQQAYEAAEPILSGEESCAEVPATTFSRLLLLVAAMGNAEAAHAMHRACRYQVRKTLKLAGFLGRHALFLALGVRSREGARLLPALLPAAEASGNTVRRYHAFCGAWAVLVGLVREDIKRVPLPSGLPVTGDNRTADVAEALTWCANETADAAKRLDDRNGNTGYTDRLRSLHEAITNVPDDAADCNTRPPD
jgi:hypothetical protein